jgi:5-methylcytosine-specific restriction endonuclease McrA
MGKPKELHRFYKSKAWFIARNIKTNATQGKCERCGAIGEEVHHKIRLTVENVNDVCISLNQDNLELLCKKCHNEEHDRFKKNKQMFDCNGNFTG